MLLLTGKKECSEDIPLRIYLYRFHDNTAHFIISLSFFYIQVLNTSNLDVSHLITENRKMLVCIIIVNETDSLTL